MKTLAFLLCSIALLTLTACGASEPNPVVLMDTSMGEVKIELYQDKAPITTANFLAYVDKKHFDNTIFHRVIPDFMIQGGGFGPNDLKADREKPTLPPIKNESDNGVANTRGTIAMARTSAPDSATAQFFINVKDNPMLDSTRGKPGYAVFGKVLTGMNVVDEIRYVKTGKVGMHDDVPVETVLIKSVRRIETKK